MNKPQLLSSTSRYWRNGVLTFAACMALAEDALAQQGNSPWETAVSVLQQAFTGPIATGLALVSIVVGGLVFRRAHSGRRDLRSRHGHRRGQIHGLALSLGLTCATLEPIPYFEPESTSYDPWGSREVQASAGHPVMHEPGGPRPDAKLDRAT